MHEHAASPYFSMRARQSWRTLGYAGLAIPFLSSLHASATSVAVATTVFVLPSVWNLVQSQRERNGDKRPAPISYQSRRYERREFGTVPFSSLFEKWKADLSFEDTITEAAYCSNEYGRRLSVICVRIPGASRATRDLVADLLRKHVRSTDEVDMVSNEEIVVCCHLLRDALSAEIIFKRLERVLRSSGPISASFPVRIGKALYPLDGYTGADLISTARSKLQPITSQ